jgi:hypothetical protein
MRHLADRLVKQYDHIRLHRIHEDDRPYTEEEALQAAIDETYTMRPDWARADLYAKLAENWADYFGIGRKIYVRSTVASWEHWYVHRATPPEVKA